MNGKRRIRERGKAWAISAALLLAAADPSWAILGLGMRFGEIILENAEIGQTYNLREAARIPLGVENQSDADVQIVMEIYPSPAGDIKEGYEPIPDPTWIKALPEKMMIGEKSVGFFDLLLSIPDDKKHVGKHYQASIKAKMVGTGMYAIAVEGRMRFSVGPGPESLHAEKKAKAMSQLDFDVTPQIIYLLDVPLGETYEVKKIDRKKAIRVANYAADDLAVAVESVPWDKRSKMPPGYEVIPDPKWISFVSSSVVVAPEGIAMLDMTLKIPDAPEHKGKKYAAQIKTGLASGFWLDAPVNVFVTTQGEKKE